jgi:hypothetical protein
MVSFHVCLAAERTLDLFASYLVASASTIHLVNTWQRVLKYHCRKRAIAQFRPLASPGTLPARTTTSNLHCKGSF